MDAYSVIDASVSVNLPYNMSLELGARNILDAEYSAWPQLNGVYGKFYNPAPPRTAYLSIRWSIWVIHKSISRLVYDYFHSAVKSFSF